MKLSFLATYNSSTKLVLSARLLVALGVIATSGFAQQTTISLGSGSTIPGGSAAINLVLAASAGAQPAGIQWTMNYSPSDIASVGVAAGASATSAGKSVICASSTGSTTCVLYGMNSNVLSSGVAAIATFNVASGSLDSLAAIQIAGVVATDANGIPIPAAGNSGSIAIVQPVAPTLSSISCAPSSVNAPGSAVCTAALSGPAWSGGSTIALSSNNANIIVPASIVVSAGQSSASFAATVGNMVSNQTAILTASLNGLSRTFTLSAVAPAQISSLSCSPSTLSSNSTGSCTIALNKAAIVASVVTLTSSSPSLTVPASVTVAANQSSATFAATSAVITAAQNVTVSASLNGVTQSSSISLTVPAQPASLSCSPATVSSPGTATCTVFLTSAAPAPGLTVALSSDQASVTLPSTITAPTGASSVNFTASVAAVTTAQTGTLTATANGVAVSSSLSIRVATWSISGSVSPSSLGSGAAIALSGASAATATVDNSGNYMFSGLSSGTYKVTPSKSGYTFTPATQSVTVKSASMSVPAFAITPIPPPSLGADVGVWKDRTVANETITSPQFSTRMGNELLLAFIATDYKAGANTIVNSVSGAGLTWELVVRTNTQSGTSEIWRAFATATESRVSVTAALSQKVVASMTVMSFTGVDTTGTNGSGAIGAVSGNNSRSGAPSAKLVTTRGNSWVFGVGNDSDRALARTPGSNQTIVHQDLSSGSNTFWVQRQNGPTAAGGSSVTINDSAPATDRFNLSIVEILVAPAAPIGGLASPASEISHARVTSLAASAPGAETSQASALTLANIATGEPGDVCSPGGLASILGSGLGAQSPEKANSFPLPTTLAGLQIKANGIAIPLLFASDSLINFQCPLLSAGTPLTLTVEGSAGTLATPILTEMQPSAPGLFTVNGTTQGVVMISNTNEIAMEATKAMASRPAKPGEFLTIYTSGLGESVEEVAAGDSAPSNRPIRLKNKVTIVVGGVEIEAAFAGLAPGSAGLYQVNVQLPTAEPIGNSIPLYLNVKSSDGTIRRSNSVNVAIQPSR